MRSFIDRAGFGLGGVRAAAHAQTTPTPRTAATASARCRTACCGSTPAPGRSRSAPRRTAGWACNTVPDERQALENEIARLQRENGALKKDMLARGLPLPGGVAGAPRPRQQRELQLKVPLPSDAEIDRVMSAFEKMWRRLVDMVQKTPGSDRI